MIELVNLKEMNKVTMLPNEVQNNIKGILTILDEAYGEDRSKNDDGGYVIVVEEKDVYFILNLCAKFSLKSQPSIYGKYGKRIL